MAEIAAQTTRLIMLSHGAGLSPADVAELESSVLALVTAAQSLRNYPLHNSDEPMLVTGRACAEPA